nr:hypothetical protein [Curtobacterium sp. MCPF17_011]
MSGDLGIGTAEADEDRERQELAALHVQSGAGVVVTEAVAGQELLDVDGIGGSDLALRRPSDGELHRQPVRAGQRGVAEYLVEGEVLGELDELGARRGEVGRAAGKDRHHLLPCRVTDGHGAVPFLAGRHLRDRVPR